MEEFQIYPRARDHNRSEADGIEFSALPAG